MLFPEHEVTTAPAVKAGPNAPLAARVRPQCLEEFAGQRHLLAPEHLLRQSIEADTFQSIILHGPPGVGKTSLAYIIARATASCFETLSAVKSNVSEVRSAIQRAKDRLRKPVPERTILFIDEIHRFNKAQQDVLLPDIETGTIRLIGATTENPLFYIVGPLVSRSQIFTLLPLSETEIRAVIARAVTHSKGFPDLTVTIDDEALDLLASHCDGDARKALTVLESVVATTAGHSQTTSIRVDVKTIEDGLQKKAVFYGDDEHYDTISAFIKSMRGSDPDAAVYWLAKMLHAGEDIRFIARRIVIFAAEDIGTADPTALTTAVAAMNAVVMIGMPEARIILSEAAIYCATCPKSNATYNAIDAALADVKDGRIQPVPVHLRDPRSAGGKRAEREKEYQYPHLFPGAVVAQTYLTVPSVYYRPSERGLEATIRQRLDEWQKQKRRMQDQG